MRRCFPSTYNVNYRNLGTQIAQNAYVEVTLDPYLTYVSSTIPLIQQIGNVHRFDVGSIPSFNGGNFSINVLVDCDSTSLGQVHCTEAHIFPDSICSPIVWTGPIIEATVSNCTNDSTTFRLRNLGSSMNNAELYSIIEEHVMVRQAPFQLGSGADQYVTVATSAGAFSRMEAMQATGFPAVLGDPIAIANNIGCNGLPVLNTPNILNQYYNGNASSFIAIDCQANRGAYDPNDKQAQPEGYEASHYIKNNIPLNYHIRFQNTGTDTAFTVVVIDTLDDPLDPATLVMGASSHPYTWQLRENGILVVTFDNIMLPDSGVNQAASNGYFKFKIEQDANNPDGTMIYNSAGIYFDFNPPIITNQVFHTIGSDFVNSIVINVDKLANPSISIKAFPNPFRDQTTLEVDGRQLRAITTTGLLCRRAIGATVPKQPRRPPHPTTRQFARGLIPLPLIG